MKILIAILVVAGLAFVGFKVWEKWDETSRQQDLQQANASQQIDGTSLPGMDQRLTKSLNEATALGVKGLKTWLDQNRNSPLLKDPRLAWIELDYAVLLSSENPAEARKIFARVKERTPADSPIQPRLQQLQKTFE